jgi:hypothetical protein
MDNPWLSLDTHGSSYILDLDRDEIERHNERIRQPAKKIVLGSIPEPFIGNPKSARIVLLGLNPGHSEDDEATYRDNSDFRNSMFRNLRHESQEYPFYPLSPAFRKTGAGRWWYARTRQMRDLSGLNDHELANRLMVIEWFPYHSISFAIPSNLCTSQNYSFQLAKQMLQDGRLVVLMRARKLWSEVDSRFGSVPCLKNHQCSYITKGNTGEWFNRILETLKSNAQPKTN